MKKAIVALVVVVVSLAAWFMLDRDTRAKPEPIRIMDLSTLVKTQSGSVVGYIEANGSQAWLGIPYARPPIGELRWHAPVEPEPWADERHSTSFGSICPQIGNVIGGVPIEAYGKVVGNEDCLYLNVWRPSGESKNLPVMFWIHGGSNTMGQAGTPTYYGANLAETHKVVVVSINYRLGPLGWFSHPALLQNIGNKKDNSGNYGTLDILQALTWVQQNISYFGGDKNNVTIFGESAGGANVLTMMASPLAKGLYDKAIVQSGGLFVSSLANAQNFSDDSEPGSKNSSAEIVNKILIRDGKATDRSAAKELQTNMGAEEIRKLLMSQTTEQLLNLYRGANEGSINVPAIFGDGYVLPANIASTEVFANSKNYNVTPVMLGTNRDEVKLFMMMYGDNLKRLLGMPYGLKDPVAYNRDAKYASEAWKVRGVDEIATNLTGAQTDPVFAYRFDWDEEKSYLGFDLGEVLGAGHGMEIAFVFGNFNGGFGLDIYDPNGIESRDALSNSMMSYWAEFAYNGDPGKGRDGKEVAWKAWQNGSNKERLMVLDTNRDKGIRMTTDLLTLDTIKDEFFADNSYKTTEAKCTAYKRLFGGEAFDEAEYASLGDCQ